MALNPAFNGDTIIQAQVAHLIKKHGIKVAVETGTYHGETTLFLAQLVSRVHTIESNFDTLHEALPKLLGNKNIDAYLGNSPQVLNSILPAIQGNILFYLDAHNPNCPLLEELEVIAKYCSSRAIIVIHDFKVPGKDFGYDSYNGHDLCLEYIEKLIPTLYPSGLFAFTYNEKAEGAYRGVIYIEPT